MSVESKQRSKTKTENPDQLVTENQDIPDNLKVPEGHVLLLRTYGRGVQKYACPVSATSKAAELCVNLGDDRMRRAAYRGW
jgi:hypothetical protein